MTSWEQRQANVRAQVRARASVLPRVEPLGENLAGATLASYSHSPATRTNPDVVAVVKKLGKLANGKHAELQVRDLVNANKKKWQIKDDNGWESIVPYQMEPDEGPAFGRLSKADLCYDN